MFLLVTGGAASGKSEYAEQRAMQAAAPRVYLATMEPFGAEAQRRIHRHRRLRAEKGFLTIECPVDIQSVGLPEKSTVLLECLSNLAANEFFSSAGAGRERAEETIFSGIGSLLSRTEDLIVVTNELFSDGTAYDSSVMEYLRLLGKLNQKLAGIADEVVEVVCGIPVIWKKGKSYETMGIL